MSLLRKKEVLWPGFNSGAKCHLLCYRCDLANTLYQSHALTPTFNSSIFASCLEHEYDSPARLPLQDMHVQELLLKKVCGSNWNKPYLYYLKVSIIDLPNEILLEIFKYLDIPSQFKMRLNKRLNQLQFGMYYNLKELRLFVSLSEVISIPTFLLALQKRYN